ncbi:hypothetical protein AB0K15_27595 [Amycolatopsis sp. NPDC049253]|uniref:hypothetical protein n=1 Tax=Amycolatopsis sp. NPDC049253 TaxID=3155274 RepID=UPI0034121D19
MTSTTGPAAQNSHDYWGPPTQPMRLPRQPGRISTVMLLLAALCGAAVIGAIWLGIALAS